MTHRLRSHHWHELADTRIFASDTTAGLHRHGLPTESDGILIQPAHLLAVTP